jgi:hypothetical protein
LKGDYDIVGTQQKFDGREVDLNRMAIRSNLKVLRARLEQLEGRRITYQEMVDDINKWVTVEKDKVSTPTLIRFANNSVNAVSYHTLEGLTLYFTRKGIKCEPGDFLVHVPDRVAA